MAGKVFEDLDGYFIWSSAWWQSEGKWVPSVYIEPKWDATQSVVHGIRYILQAAFDDEKTAIRAAMAFGRDHVLSGEIGM